MVFCGKPSKGCLNCRKRRIKCDQVQPSCSQCLRAEKECTGYRDQLELQFRDENATVLMRTEKKRAKQMVDRTKARSSSPRKAPSSKGSPINKNASSPPSNVSRSHSPEEDVARILRDAGLMFFFTHYVVVLHTSPTGEMVVDSSPLWRDFHLNFPLLLTTASCVGYAGLANVSKNPDFLIIARNKYATAIRAIKSKLENASNEDFDSLFRAVMMLAVFEIINGTVQGKALGIQGCASGSWSIHIEGAAALLKMINSQPSDTVMAPPVRVQLQFCFSALVNSLSNSEPIPLPVREWSQQFSGKLGDGEAPAVDLMYLCCSFVDLDALAKSDQPIDPEILLAQARGLEAALDSWEAGLPSRWSFSIGSSTDNASDIYDGKTHTYTDLWTARIYDNYRWTRIQVNEMLFRLLPEKRWDEMDDQHAEERQKCLDTTLRMAEDICCSVPSVLSRRSPENAAYRSAPPLSGCFVILYPLAIAGGAVGVSDKLHLFAVRILSEIGHSLGIKQALQMAKAIKSQRAQREMEELHELFTTNAFGDLD